MFSLFYAPKITAFPRFDFQFVCTIEAKVVDLCKPVDSPNVNSGANEVFFNFIPKKIAAKNTQDPPLTDCDTDTFEIMRQNSLGTESPLSKSSEAPSSEAESTNEDLEVNGDILSLENDVFFDDEDENEDFEDNEAEKSWDWKRRKSKRPTIYNEPLPPEIKKAPKAKRVRCSPKSLKESRIGKLIFLIEIWKERFKLFRLWFLLNFFADQPMDLVGKGRATNSIQSGNICDASGTKSAQEKDLNKSKLFLLEF